MVKQFKKRAQMQLSFGMIFSIILIIAFIAFAFYAIRYFLNLQEETQIKDFIRTLQGDIDEVWGSTKSNESKQYFLPEKIKRICFEDSEFGNLVLEKDGPRQRETLNNVDIAKTLSENSGQRVCIDNIQGKINLNLIKDFRETLVTITR
ncbi:MAG TPA: hypothetical protein PLK34_03045 [Candidatus Pacearchaeota archaeon]|nr:hypothetical protein [Candidatus Pacearchaeota archaeon]